MQGGLTKAADNASCTCMSNYYWNPGANRCDCDFSKNFAVFNGNCTDCRYAPNSNGLANAFGCVCLNGLSWDSASGACLCPSGSVFIGNQCTPCSSASLPAGSTLADCQSCSNSKGFAKQTLGCYSCASQTGASAAVTNGTCTCSGTGQAWKPLLGLCACDWNKFYVTISSKDGTNFTCRYCP